MQITMRTGRGPVEIPARLINKLMFWAAKRIQGKPIRAYDYQAFLAGRGNRGLNTDLREIAKDNVYQYILEFLQIEDEAGLTQYAANWHILSQQEKSALVKGLFNLGFDYRQKLPDWFIKSDWYEIRNDGSYVVLAEEQVDEVVFEGRQIGLTTINSYGAEVLNCDTMAIIDVDLESESEDSIVVKDQDVALLALRAYAERNPNLGFRVYRTAGGLRYICTTCEMNPAGSNSDRMMKYLLADPKYRMLCRYQETYRARLTPKPWRADKDEEFDDRVCKLIEVVGERKVLDNFSKAIEYHDSKCGVEMYGRALA